MKNLKNAWDIGMSYASTEDKIIHTDDTLMLTIALVRNCPQGGALHAYDENTNSWLKMAGRSDATFSFSFNASWEKKKIYCYNIKLLEDSSLSD